MTVVLYMRKCPFCKKAHYTDQPCTDEFGNEDDTKKLYAA